MDQQVQESLHKQQEIVKRYLENAHVASTAAATTATARAAATTYSYDCQVSIAAVGGGFLNVDFKKNGSTFAQFSGGFGGGVGGYTGWGTAWFNTPVEDLIGQGAAFTVEVVGVLGGTAHVQITNANSFIGNCSTGGVGIGGGVGAGGGTFKKY
jgi:hypothetical protein